MRGDRLRLADILERIDRILDATRSGAEEFRESAVLPDAAIRNLEVIGEAAAGLGLDLRREHPEVPWKAIIGFRHLATHAYWQFRRDRIWGIVESLPGLRRKAAAKIAPD
jgi:uncharacterized protein with HEPN domain